jgi:hypothetical protein
MNPTNGHKIHVGRLLLLVACSLLSCSKEQVERIQVDEQMYSTFKTHVESLRKQIAPDVSSCLFMDFIVGYVNITSAGLLKKDNPVTIIDYTRPSNVKRLFVLDLEKRRVIMKSLVAHGRNSGMRIARHFSNKKGSKQTCLGFLVTRGTYSGKHGYSLKLDGVEKGINDNALKRAIVIHGADYVSDEFVSDYGRCGRSWGCPALPTATNRQIIDAIRGGSLVFAYGTLSDNPASSTFRVVRKQTVAQFKKMFGDSPPLSAE